MSSLSAVRADKEGMNTMWTGGRDQNSNDQTPTWIGIRSPIYFIPNYPTSNPEDNLIAYYFYINQFFSTSTEHSCTVKNVLCRGQWILKTSTRLRQQID